VLTKVRMGGWSHVVLQGQSVEPILDPANFQTYAKKFADEARAVGAVPLFYETWARKAGDPVYQQPWSGGTPAAMQAGLRQGYQTAAAMGHGIVSPAGDAWELELAEPHPLNMFMPDGSHPSENGTYLNGCVFYRVLTMRSAVGLGAIPAGVTSTGAAALQQIADRLSL
jgi:hypothetical protein